MVPDWHTTERSLMAHQFGYSVCQSSSGFGNVVIQLCVSPVNLSAFSYHGNISLNKHIHKQLHSTYYF